MFLRTEAAEQAEQDRIVECSREIFAAVRSAYPKGAPNYLGKSDLIPYVNFAREINTFCKALFKQWISAKDEASRQLIYAILDLTTLGLISELYGCGACGEQSSSVMRRFLSANIYYPNVECIGFEGVYETTQEDDNHFFVVVNRDTSAHEIDIDKWFISGKTVVTIDTWLNSSIQVLDAENPPDKQDLCQKSLVVSSGMTDVKLDRDLTQLEWKEVARLLKFAAEKLETSHVKLALKTCQLGLRAEIECLKIQYALEDLARSYSQYAKAPGARFFQPSSSISINDDYFPAEQKASNQVVEEKKESKSTP